MRQPLVLAAVLVAAALALLGVGLGGGFLASRWVADSGRPRIANTTTVVTQIQALSQLVAVKYVFEKVVNLDDYKWYGQNRLLMIAHGVAKAGVDLQKVTRDDVLIRGDHIAITLPRPILTDVYLEENRTEVLERSTGLLRPFDQQMEQEARRQALEEIRKTARAAGILQDAEERTRLQLTVLARAAGFQAVEIHFR